MSNITVEEVVVQLTNRYTDKQPLKWLSPADNCDICKKELKSEYKGSDWFVDGATKWGPWALMCPKCFKKHGKGLGLGRGQKYAIDSKIKIEG